MSRRRPPDLDESQRAMVAARIATMRQGERTDLASIEATSQSDAAGLLGVGRANFKASIEALNQSDAAGLHRAQGRPAVNITPDPRAGTLPGAPQDAAVDGDPIPSLAAAPTSESEEQP